MKLLRQVEPGDDDNGDDWVTVVMTVVTAVAMAMMVVAEVLVIPSMLSESRAELSGAARATQRRRAQPPSPGARSTDS